MGSQEAGSQADALDFVIYLFVLGPLVELCLKSKRINPGNDRRRGIALAIAVLAAVASIKVWIDMSSRQPNYFEILEVPTTASFADVKRAYKAKSLEMHPDKNPEDPSAQDKFTQMRSAYEVLSDTRLRDIYNKFGEAGIEEDKTSAQGGQWALMAVFYVIWVVLSFLLTMGKQNTQARVWVYVGLVALAVFEYQSRMVGVDYLAELFPFMTIFQKIDVLHKLFPPFMHGAKMIGQVIYVDPEAYNKALLEGLHEKVNSLAMMLRAVHLELDGLKAGAGRGGAGAGAGAGGAQPRSTAEALADASARADLFATRTASGDATPAGVKSLHPAVLGAAAAGAADGGAAGAAKAGAGGGGSQKLTNVLYFFLIYFAFQWLGGQKD